MSSGHERMRARSNYEMKQMTFDDESAYVDEEGDPDREPYSAGSSSQIDRKRSRLSFYLNRRSAGAVAYWQKKQLKEEREAEERAAAFESIEPTAQNYRSAAQQALVAAMDVNKETLHSIKQMEHVMNETEAIGAESAVIIRQGQENLEVVDSTLVNMEPILKRAKKDLIQFFRRMMRDKICMCLVFIVLGLVIAVVITTKLKGEPALPINVAIQGNLTNL